MRACAVLIAVTVACLGEPLRAQSRDTSLKGAVQGTSLQTPPSCCSIVRIDTATSVVTARETATGYTFRFVVKTRRVLRALRIGQPIWADFANSTVKLKPTDATPCCGIMPQEPS